MVGTPILLPPGNSEAGVDVWRVAEIVPGALALLGSAVGYGRLTQKVKDMQEQLASSVALRAQVARIDERTKALDSKINKVDAQVDRLVTNLIEDKRPRSQH